MLDINFLQLADIIFSTTSHVVSAGIRWVTYSNFSHSMLYVGDGQIIEADWPEVHQISWEEKLAKSEKDKAPLTLAVVKRRENMDAHKCNAVVQAARDLNGRPFDVVGMIGAGMHHPRAQHLAKAVCDSSYSSPIPGISPITGGCVAIGALVYANATDYYADDRFFCSELIARVYTLANADCVIVEGRATDTSPAKLANSPFLLPPIGRLI